MIEDIKKRSENFKNDYLPFFNNNGEMHEWNAMYADNLYLLSIIEQAAKDFEGICDLIDDESYGQAWIKSDEALKAIRK